jgi:hypothetical protein
MMERKQAILPPIQDNNQKVTTMLNETIKPALTTITILTAFLCGVVYGYGAALMAARHRRANCDAFLAEFQAHVVAAPPPGYDDSYADDEDWIDKVEERITHD